MARFWEHWLTAMLLLTPYSSTLLKIKTLNSLGSVKAWRNLLRKNKIIDQMSSD